MRVGVGEVGFAEGLRGEGEEGRQWRRQIRTPPPQRQRRQRRAHVVLERRGVLLEALVHGHELRAGPGVFPSVRGDSLAVIQPGQGTPEPGRRGPPGARACGSTAPAAAFPTGLNPSIHPSNSTTCTGPSTTGQVSLGARSPYPLRADLSYRGTATFFPAALAVGRGRGRGGAAVERGGGS